MISHENVNNKNVGHIKLYIFFLFPFHSILFYFVSFIYLLIFFLTFFKRKTFLQKQFFSINLYFANKNKELGTIVNVGESLHFVHLIRNINNKSTFEVEKVLHNWIFLISSLDLKGHFFLGTCTKYRKWRILRRLFNEKE